MLPDQPVAHHRAMVTRLYVERLFGHYTYDLSFRADDVIGASPRVLLLYGDNGSGKTTIAKLLYHILSPSDGRGHRTFLAQTKFVRFRVEFSTGASLSAERSKGIVGPYNLTAHFSGHKPYSVFVDSREGRVKTGDLDDARLANLYRVVAAPMPTVFYLSDNRMLYSDEFAQEENDAWMSHSSRLVSRKLGDTAARERMSHDRRDFSVEWSLWRAEMWMRRQAIAAANTGEQSTSTVYSDIVRRIAQPHGDMDRTIDQLPRLTATLEHLAAQSEPYVALGMIPKMSVGPLLKSISGSTDPARRAMLANVIEPYVNSIKARLTALERVQTRLSTFLEIANTFYRRKSVRVTLGDGIQVFDDHGAPLEPGLLSSGEKQLMLLLCNVLIATAQPTLFIMDEPELSLNIKWQRLLVDSLLRLVEGSPVQFIMATHSLELLTKHRHSVLRLSDVKGGRQRGERAATFDR